MQKAFMAYKRNPNNRGFIEEDAHTWADVQAMLNQPFTPLSWKISRVASKIAGINVSVLGDSIMISSGHVAITWSYVKMLLKVAVVSSTPYYTCSERWS